MWVQQFPSTTPSITTTNRQHYIESNALDGNVLSLHVWMFGRSFLMEMLDQRFDRSTGYCIYHLDFHGNAGQTISTNYLQRADLQ